MMREMMQMLRLQWMASRWLLLALVLVCIGLPQIVLRMAEVHARYADPRTATAALIESLSVTSRLFAFVAMAAGVAVALSGWNWDHRTGHVYALSLPIPRWRYALLKLWAGGAALIIPALAIWIGALLGLMTTDIPEGLHAYPFAFGARFLLCSIVFYGLLFALASGTVRTTLMVTIVPLAIIVVGGIAAGMLNEIGIDVLSPLEAVFIAVREWPGPFQVFGGSWLLIDV